MSKRMLAVLVIVLALLPVTQAQATEDDSITGLIGGYQIPPTPTPEPTTTPTATPSYEPMATPEPKQPDVITQTEQFVQTAIEAEGITEDSAAADDYGTSLLMALVF